MIFQVIYIGHSMGTTMFWVAMNEAKELMKRRVFQMIALGPVATVKHINSPIRLLAPFTKDFEVSNSVFH